jgi:hypothetical protein
MKTVKPPVFYLIEIIVVATLLFWIAAIFFAYVADDRRAPAADERSVPAPRSY